MLMKIVRLYFKCPTRVIFWNLSVLELDCIPCHTSEFWQVHRHVHHQTRSAIKIRNSLLSCIPYSGRTPILGVEGMRSWAYSLCLHRLEMNFQCKIWIWVRIHISLKDHRYFNPGFWFGCSLGLNQSLCLQADPNVTLISSHPFCLIPWENSLVSL